QAEALSLTELNDGALFDAEFGIGHRGSTVPERSGVALSFRGRHFNFRECRLAFHVFAHELLIVEAEPYIWCPGRAEFSAIQAAAEKISQQEKNI
ncbi:hypothetical protein, partial [Pseudomonas sp. MF7451]|uniref:hypothetical protein n=1 Tax=Pseudomonas sp. MF7451 TaxID=2797538 RepID=UPI001E53574D